jgi:hypothetical protein
VIVSLQGECDISMLFASLARVARLSRRILSGFTSLIAAAQFLLLGLSCAYAQQGDACVDNSYVLNQYPGSIFVSDTAVTYSYSNCPRGESRLGQKIKLRVGQSLYFWFRVQGDRAYLSTAQSYQPFRLNFSRDNGSGALVDQGYLDMGYLDRSTMIFETQTSGGQFDWRLGAEKWKFSIPGLYQIMLSQGQITIDCPRSNLLSSSCSWQIEVVP